VEAESGARLPVEELLVIMCAFSSPAAPLGRFGILQVFGLGLPIIGGSHILRKILGLWQATEKWLSPLPKENWMVPLPLCKKC